MSARARKNNIGGLGAVYRGIYLQIAAALITALAICARVGGGVRAVVVVIVVLLSVFAALMILLGLTVSARSSVHFQRGRIFCLIYLALMGAGILAYLFWFRSLVHGSGTFSPQIIWGISIYVFCLAISDVLTLAGVLNGCAQNAGLYGEKMVGIRCRFLWFLSLLTVVAAAVLVFLFVQSGAAIITQVVEENGGAVNSLDAFYGKLKPLVILIVLFVADFLLGLFLRFRMASRIRYCLRTYHGKSLPVAGGQVETVPVGTASEGNAENGEASPEVSAPGGTASDGKAAPEVSAPGGTASAVSATEEAALEDFVTSKSSSPEESPTVDDRSTVMIPPEKLATERVEDEGRQTVMIPSGKPAIEHTIVGGTPSKSRSAEEETPTLESMLSDYISSENNG